MTVEVMGQQWSWTFNYGVGEQDTSATGEPSRNGEAGDFAYDDYVYTSGTARNIPTLVLPVDQTVQFNLHSPDVIHDFGVPSFLVKMDVIPGRVNKLQVTPTVEGTLQGQVLRALRCLALADALQRRGRQPGRLRLLPGRPGRGRQHR